MARKTRHSFSVDVQDGDVTLDVVADISYRHARVCGPPENWAPGEGDLKVVSVEIDGKAVPYVEWDHWSGEINEAGWEEYERGV